MRHYFIFRYRWVPQHTTQWPYYSFLARLDKGMNRLIVPYMEEKEDGTIEDPFSLRRLIVITELTQIGAQSIPELKRTIPLHNSDTGNEETSDCKISVYTMDFYQARVEPLLEGGPLEVIFEDEIVNQGNVFGTLVGSEWTPILQMSLKGDEKVRGLDVYPPPLIRYHGTSKVAYRGIIRNGLRPTTRLGMMGNNLYYLGHFAKALRYSFADSQRDGGIREDPILLRYAVFVREKNVLRVVKGRSEYGVIETKELTKDEYRMIPEKNKWLLDSDDSYKDFALALYHKGFEIGSPKTVVSPFTVMQRETPFETLEEARVALLIGDQEKRRDPATYFTGEDKKLIGDTEVVPPRDGGWKAYEVDSFWIPVKDTRMPTGVRYYSFTKYPEIAIQPEEGIIALNGSFQPRIVRPGEYSDDWLRDPFVLMETLRSGKRALSMVEVGTYIKTKYG